jgi:hypothetical protein
MNKRIVSTSLENAMDQNEQPVASVSANDAETVKQEIVKALAAQLNFNRLVMTRVDTLSSAVMELANTVKLLAEQGETTGQ